MLEINRVVLIVLDSVGVGSSPDADEYGDGGSNTLGHVARAAGGLKLPNLGSLGLGNIIPVLGVPPAISPLAAWGRLQPASVGKDTTTGHWELAGIILKAPFPLYPEGFPLEIIRAVEAAMGRKILGNVVASGTEIIARLGAKHMDTGWPIVYTSADSVFQIAAHEDVIPLAELYDLCLKARGILQGEHGVARVIARPFTGKVGSFVRTGNRRDFSLKPPRRTILDCLSTAEKEVIGIGKIENIFAGRGITLGIRTGNNKEGMAQTLTAMGEARSGLIFVNLVDFDMHYGHRNDPLGYAGALEEFDRWLPQLLGVMTDTDLLIITADHGCDPTTAGTDHSREYVPLLVWNRKIPSGICLGERQTFADVAATIAALFGIDWPGPGTSFHLLL